VSESTIVVLMPSQQFFPYIMLIASYLLLRWWRWYLHINTNMSLQRHGITSYSRRHFKYS